MAATTPDTPGPDTPEPDTPDLPEADLNEQMRFRRAKRERLLAEGRAPYAVEVVRTPFPISMMMYFSPVRTTLQLPEEPEYNEMNSDISNLKKRTSPSWLHKSSLSGKLLQNRLRGSE